MIVFPFPTSPRFSPPLHPPNSIPFFFLFLRNRHIKNRQNLIKNKTNKKLGKTHMYRDTYTQNTHTHKSPNWKLMCKWKTSKVQKPKPNKQKKWQKYFSKSTT